MIGNGLGRAIDNEYFELEKGMDKAWESLEGYPKIREIISSIIDPKEKPEKEQDLKEIQKNIFYLIQIRQAYEKLTTGIKKDILTDPEKIEKQYYKYLLFVAKYFSDYKDEETSDEASKFLKGFSDYIETNRPHIATLNYDTILYRHFIKTKIVDGFKGSLADGIADNGFQEGFLYPRFDNNYGCYLHLHGSPLFYTDKDGKIKKNAHDNGAFAPVEDDGNERHHIILCHPEQKYELIQHSSLLSIYFNFFKTALEEAENIIIIGYGGMDEHINDAIRNSMKNKSKKIYIVERSDPDISDNEKKKFWVSALKPEGKNRCKSKIIYKFCSTILNFDFKFKENSAILHRKT